MTVLINYRGIATVTKGKSFLQNNLMLERPVATQIQKVFETYTGLYAYLRVYVSVLAYQEEINNVHILSIKDLKPPSSTANCTGVIKEQNTKFISTLTLQTRLCNSFIAKSPLQDLSNEANVF